MDKKKILIGVLIVLGLSAIGGAGFLYYHAESQEVSVKTVYVPSRDFGMYQILGEGDLVATNVPITQDLTQYTVRKNEIVGKAAMVNLYAGTLIPKKALKDTTDVQDIVFVTIHTSYTRSGGARVGDRVMISDVQETLINNIRNVTEKVIAKDARVISVTDLKGKKAYEVNKDNLLSVKAPVEAVTLAVKKSDAEKSPELKAGAVSQENSLVLTVLYENNKIEVENVKLKTDDISKQEEQGSSSEETEQKDLTDPLSIVSPQSSVTEE